MAARQWVRRRRAVAGRLIDVNVESCGHGLKPCSANVSVRVSL